MTILDAIERADAMRPNAMALEYKRKWVLDLDEDVRKMMKSDAAGKGEGLLLEAPHDEAYVFFLASMIDIYNADMSLYANDKAVYEAAIADARAEWRRDHKPSFSGRWVL